MSVIFLIVSRKFSGDVILYHLELTSINVSQSLVIFTWYLLDILNARYDLHTDSLMEFVPVNAVIVVPVL